MFPLLKSENCNIGRKEFLRQHISICIHMSFKHDLTFKEEQIFLELIWDAKN